MGMTNTSTTQIPADRRVGSILGLAYGDATGDPVEFRKYHEIMKNGVGIPARLRVTDDTQMSLAVWDAIWAWDSSAPLGHLRLELAATFGAWYHDPDNNRAPGGTCLTALGALERLGLGGWTEATSHTSAGCGSVMRAPWIGLVEDLDDEQVERVAMLQAVLTHGPAENAYVAAALAALTRALARGEVVPGDCAAWLAEWAAWLAECPVYDEVVLSNLWRKVKQSDRRGEGHASQLSYVMEGLGHVAWVADAADRLASALTDEGFWSFDPCAVAGEGWRARETVAVAVGILDALGGPADAREALLRAAATNGDSDSIGAITGALVGAAYGEVWPADWLLRVEPRYQAELAVAAGLAWI